MERLELILEQILDRSNRSKERYPTRHVCKVPRRAKNQTLDRLTRIRACGSLWDFAEMYFERPEPEEVKIETGDEKWDEILNKALNRRRGRPRKEREKPKILPGSRVGDMYARVGNEYTCSRYYWDDEVRESREVPSGVALEIFEEIMYGGGEE
ncbi:MAG: hypothetical protein DRP85_09065 [Candidatus Makaraimicrobium thalassicum]|nr:MAG: hypothetical protein DRP85_09065 [Candidatus Omnitrophota bacterium]